MPPDAQRDEQWDTQVPSRSGTPNSSKDSDGYSPGTASASTHNSSSPELDSHELQHLTSSRSGYLDSKDVYSGEVGRYEPNADAYAHSHKSAAAAGYLQQQQQQQQSQQQQLFWSAKGQLQYSHFWQPTAPATAGSSTAGWPYWQQQYHNQHAAHGGTSLRQRREMEAMRREMERCVGRCRVLGGALLRLCACA
jgi:hypothetical protein